jgi:predicted ArsR family transcriptional regulator
MSASPSRSQPPTIRLVTAAKAETKQLDPTEGKVKTGRRKLDNLVNKGLAEKGEGSPVSPDGGRGSTAASYYLTDKGRIYMKW